MHIFIHLACRSIGDMHAYTHAPGTGRAKVIVLSQQHKKPSGELFLFHKISVIYLKEKKTFQK